VNPWARLWAYEFRGDRLASDEDPITRLRFHAHTAGVQPTVANLSFSEDAGQFQTALERLIIKHRDSVLFVAAAGCGDGRIDNDSSCRVSPACMSTHPADAANLISVVALDAKGAQALSSTVDPPNFGPVFDVAAVGDVVGPFHGNAFGRMQGSSVAASYVTGLVSLI
jgi:subtilisin family serine protease